MKRAFLHSGITADVCAPCSAIPVTTATRIQAILALCSVSVLFIFYYGPQVGNLGLVVFYETPIYNIANVGREKITFLLPIYILGWGSVT